jgi:hypothetical protein
MSRCLDPTLRVRVLLVLCAALTFTAVSCGTADVVIHGTPTPLSSVDPPPQSVSLESALPVPGDLPGAWGEVPPDQFDAAFCRQGIGAGRYAESAAAAFASDAPGIFPPNVIVRIYRLRGSAVQQYWNDWITAAQWCNGSAPGLRIVSAPAIGVGDSSMPYSVTAQQAQDAVALVRVQDVVAVVTEQTVDPAMPDWGLVNSLAKLVAARLSGS